MDRPLRRFVRELTRGLGWKRNSISKARHTALSRRAEKQRRKELVRRAMEHRRRAEALPFRGRDRPLRRPPRRGPGAKSDVPRHPSADGGNTVIGRFYTGKSYRPRGSNQSWPVIHPAAITPAQDAQGQMQWYRDANNDGRNDLLVDLGALRGYPDQCYANDINSRGEVAGSSVDDVVPGAVSYSRAVIWRNGMPVDLNTLTDNPSLELASAASVTETGQILALASGGHFYLLLPINVESAAMAGVTGGADIPAPARTVTGAFGRIARVPARAPATDDLPGLDSARSELEELLMQD